MEKIHKNMHLFMYKTGMLSCIKHACFHVFYPFSAYFFPHDIIAEKRPFCTLVTAFALYFSLRFDARRPEGFPDEQHASGQEEVESAVGCSRPQAGLGHPRNPEHPLPDRCVSSREGRIDPFPL